MNPIGPIVTSTSRVAEPLSASTAAGSAVRKVAKEFETLLVHQLLDAAKIAGSGTGTSGGYMGMAVDALASGVSDAGGLGLSKQIEAALSRSR